MNFVNLDQYKQNGDSGDFFEFKFEWEEREDELEFFNFKDRLASVLLEILNSSCFRKNGNFFRRSFWSAFC